ncbi:hypothetical protein Q5C_01000 [Leuconostoc pseudomesenteroides 4882]|nr:hypothetical protein Q5C_01000 [Leuconostoc pseudomesenteroides 4882]
MDVERDAVTSKSSGQMFTAFCLDAEFYEFLKLTDANENSK